MIGASRLTTERKDRPIARKTLLFASSGCSTTCGGGNWGKLLGRCTCAGSGFVAGVGFILRGCGGGSGDWRRRAEGFIIMFWRILVA